MTSPGVGLALRQGRADAPSEPRQAIVLRPGRTERTGLGPAHANRHGRPRRRRACRRRACSTTEHRRSSTPTRMAPGADCRSGGSPRRRDLRLGQRRREHRPAHDRLQQRRRPPPRRPPRTNQGTNAQVRLQTTRCRRSDSPPPRSQNEGAPPNPAPDTIATGVALVTGQANETDHKFQYTHHASAQNP